MHSLSIDGDGYIDNPHAVNNPSLVGKKLWGAIVCRAGKKTQILSFLPRDDPGRKIEIRGILPGVYLEFGAVGEKKRSLYVVNEVTDKVISLRSVDVSTVPKVYDVESITPTKIHILEAQQTLIELQMDALRSGLADITREYAASQGISDRSAFLIK